jgi:excinuclease ABC subunit A
MDDESALEEKLFSARYSCPYCDYSLQELEPRMFSFNNPNGACPECDGLGVSQFFDPDRVVSSTSVSLAGGAVRGWDRRNAYYFQIIQALARHYGFSVDTPFEELPKKIRDVVLYGSGDEIIEFRYFGDNGMQKAPPPFRRHHSEPRAPLPRNRFPHRPRRAVEVHQPAGLQFLPRPAPQP